MGNPSEQLQKLRDAASLPGKPDMETQPVPEGYQAFTAVDRTPRRLRICPANRAWERVTYGYLYRIVENGPYGTQIALVFNFMVVIIKGKNLQLIADAIDREQCEAVWMYDYDPERWEKPRDESAPFVASIEIHVEKPADALEEIPGYRAPISSAQH
jgi:hypothetical protein